MTPFEITGLGIILSYYLMKWLRGREKKLGECLWDYLDEGRKSKSGGIVSGNFNTLLQPGLRDQFRQLGLGNSALQSQQQSGLQGILGGLGDLGGLEGQLGRGGHYPGKIYMVDPVVEIYDEEYWSAWKAKHKHEEDGG